MKFCVELATVVRSAWKILVEKHEGRGSLGEIGCMWMNTIKIS
jgi:hypothetical protein